MQRVDSLPTDQPLVFKMALVTRWSTAGRIVGRGCAWAIIIALVTTANGLAQYRYYQGVAPGFRPQPTGFWDVGGAIGMRRPEASLATDPTVATVAPGTTLGSDATLGSDPTIASGPPVAWAPVVAGPTMGTPRNMGTYYRSYRASTKPFTQIQRPDPFNTYRFLLESDGVDNGWYDELNHRWYDEFGYD